MAVIDCAGNIYLINEKRRNAHNRQLYSFFYSRTIINKAKTCVSAYDKWASSLNIFPDHALPIRSRTARRRKWNVRTETPIIRVNRLFRNARSRRWASFIFDGRIRSPQVWIKQMILLLYLQLVEPEVYQQHLAKSIAQAENNAGNKAFHCKTPDCPGWCIYDDDVNNFLCPVCGANNCLTCQVRAV